MLDSDCLTNIPRCAIIFHKCTARTKTLKDIDKQINITNNRIKTTNYLVRSDGIPSSVVARTQQRCTKNEKVVKDEVENTPF